jgi:MFS family permease
MARVRDAGNDAEQDDWQSREAGRQQSAHIGALGEPAGEPAQFAAWRRPPPVDDLTRDQRSTTSSLTVNSPARGFTSVLRNPYFLRLWMAQLISQTALNAANFGLIILVQTQIKSVTATGGAIVMFALPALIFGAPAGVVVDRFDRRTVLWVSNLLRAGVSGLFVLVLLTHQPTLIPAYILAFLLATISQFFAPAEGAAIPLLVYQDELINALSLFNVTFTLAQVAGLIILGPLVFLLVTNVTLNVGIATVPLAPAEVLFVMLSALYLLCAGLILLIPHDRLVPPQGSAGPTRPLHKRREPHQILSLWRGMLQSWSYIRRDQRLLVSAFQLAFAGSCIAVIAMMAPQFVNQFFHRPAALAALVFVPAGAGLVIGSALVPRIHRYLGFRGTVIVGVVALSVSAALLPLMHALAVSAVVPDVFFSWPYMSAILALTFVIGVALDLINVPAQNMLQERAPDWIKGRVLAVQALLLNAVTIPFVLVLGWVADIWGLMSAIEVLAVVMAVLGVGSVHFGRASLESSDTREASDDQIRPGHAAWHDTENGSHNSATDGFRDRW